MRSFTLAALFVALALFLGLYLSGAMQVMALPQLLAFFGARS